MFRPYVSKIFLNVLMRQCGESRIQFAQSQLNSQLCMLMMAMMGRLQMSACYAHEPSAKGVPQQLRASCDFIRRADRIRYTRRIYGPAQQMASTARKHTHTHTVTTNTRIGAHNYTCAVPDLLVVFGCEAKVIILRFRAQQTQVACG